jgi:hypothetical protein
VTSTGNPMLLRVLEVASMWLKERCKTALMAVKTCSKAILAHSLRHGKSPYFLQVTFQQLVSPDYTLLVLPCVDGQKFLECAL